MFSLIENKNKRLKKYSSYEFTIIFLLYSTIVKYFLLVEA